MHQIVGITLPRVTRGWLARARADLEENPIGLSIQRDEHTEEFRAKYEVGTGIGFWADDIELFVGNPTDPFAGIVMFKEIRPSWQTTFEWLPQPDGSEVVRFDHFTFGPAYPDVVEEAHQYWTELEMCWGTPATVRYRREWELSTLGNTPSYGQRWEFLKLLRSNDRLRRLQELDAPQIILEGEAGLLEKSLEQLYEVYPHLPRADVFPVADELLYQMLCAAGYNKAGTEELWQRKEQPSNVWDDSLTLAEAWWECAINIGEEEPRGIFTCLGLEGEQQVLRETFLRTELGVSRNTLYRFFDRDCEDPAHPVSKLIVRWVKEASRKLVGYTERKMKMVGELAEFLAWLEAAQ